MPVFSDEQKQLIKEQDEDLDQMCSLLEDMKHISSQMNSTLASHSKAIDKIGV
jgi:hypothetical protein